MRKNGIVNKYEYVKEKITMDTPTIAEYYREADPRKRKALLEQALASGEDMEANGIRREIW